MALYNTFYSLAHYYDIAFRRDMSGEVAFLRTLFERETGRAPDSLADLACGPGYHARDFARHGLRAVGLDLRPEMVEFACAEAEAEGCH